MHVILLNYLPAYSLCNGDYDGIYNSYNMAVRGVQPLGFRCIYQQKPSQPWYQLIYTTPSQCAFFIYKAHFTLIVVYYVRVMITR